MAPERGRSDAPDPEQAHKKRRVKDQTTTEDLQQVPTPTQGLRRSTRAAAAKATAKLASTQTATKTSTAIKSANAIASKAKRPAPAWETSAPKRQKATPGTKQAQRAHRQNAESTRRNDEVSIPETAERRESAQASRSKLDVQKQSDLRRQVFTYSIAETEPIHSLQASAKHIYNVAETKPRGERPGFQILMYGSVDTEPSVAQHYTASQHGLKGPPSPRSAQTDVDGFTCVRCHSWRAHADRYVWTPEEDICFHCGSTPTSPSGDLHGLLSERASMTELFPPLAIPAYDPTRPGDGMHTTRGSKVDRVTHPAADIPAGFTEEDWANFSSIEAALSTDIEPDLIDPDLTDEPNIASLPKAMSPSPPAAKASSQSGSLYKDALYSAGLQASSTGLPGSKKAARVRGRPAGARLACIPLPDAEPAASEAAAEAVQGTVAARSADVTEAVDPVQAADAAQSATARGADGVVQTIEHTQPDALGAGPDAVQTAAAFQYADIMSTFSDLPYPAELGNVGAEGQYGSRLASYQQSNLQVQGDFGHNSLDPATMFELYQSQVDGLKRAVDEPTLRWNPTPQALQDRFLEPDSILPSIFSITEAIEWPDYLPDQTPLEPLALPRGYQFSIYRPMDLHMLSDTQMYETDLQALLGQNTANNVVIDRALRTRRPLFLPFCQRKKVNCGNKSELQIAIEKDKANRKGHWVLFVAEVPSSHEGFINTLQAPVMTYFDSCNTVSPGGQVNAVHDGDAKRVAKYLDWYSGPPPTGGPRPPIPWLPSRAVATPPQAGRWACGLHVILNAWCYALGLSLNAHFEASETFYRQAFEVVNIATNGAASSGFLYAFLAGSRYAMPQAGGVHFSRAFGRTVRLPNSNAVLGRWSEVKAYEDFIKAGMVGV